LITLLWLAPFLRYKPVDNSVLDVDDLCGRVFA